MLWLYIILSVVGSFIALFLLASIVGRFLPERYAASVTLLLDKKPDKVWTAINDYQSNPVTGRMRKKTEPLPNSNGLPAWKENIGSSTISVTTEYAEAPNRLKRNLADSVVPMTAEWEIAIEPTTDGSRVRATNVTVIRNGTWHVPIFRVMMTLINGVKLGLKSYARQLATNMNAKLRYE
jgi:hypothetical protein